jgi:hypothetical protein
MHTWKDDTKMYPEEIDHGVLDLSHKARILTSHGLL